MKMVRCLKLVQSQKDTEHSLCLLYEVGLVFGDGPHGFEDDGKVIANGELVVELTAGSGALHICKHHQQGSRRR